MGKTTAAKVFSHTDSDFIFIVFSALKCTENLTDDYLCREANIVVSVFFAESDCFFSADIKWNCSYLLSTEGSSHNLAECM